MIWNTQKDWMALLAKSDPVRLAALLPDLPDHSFLRAPEVGAEKAPPVSASSGWASGILAKTEFTSNASDILLREEKRKVHELILFILR